MPIAKNVKLGKNIKIPNPNLVNLYGCEIGDNCIIGTFVEIRKGVRIGNKVKIQAFTFIPEGVVVEDEVFIGPHVVFTNDLYPRATNADGTLKSADDWKEVPTIIQRKASIGANATILCGVTIGEGALVGAGSTVTTNVPSWTVVVGNPSKVLHKIQKKNRF